MINKPFHQIDPTDIISLVDNATPESRALDYKETLPGNTRDDKKEFLADICAFANAGGGDVFYGIPEERDDNGKSTGIPTEARGLPGINTDAEILRLDNIIRDGIAPRVGIQIQALPSFPQGPILHIRIPSSWAAPHMVTFGGASRFYARNSAGKFQLDVGEIRAAFAASDELPQRIQNFRAERLAKIIAEELPVPLVFSPKIVFHVAPISAFNPQTREDVSSAAKQFLQWLNPIYSEWNNHRHNFDGFLTYTNYQRDENTGYAQIFRNGIIEAVDARILRPYRDEELIIPTTDIEGRLLNRLTEYFRLFEALNLQPPIIIMLSFIGVKGYIIPLRHPFPNGSKPIDRDVLSIPDMLVESFDEDSSAIMRPIFDIVWQSAGYERSLNFTDEGEWKPRR